jgi:hypothetical protein
MGLTLSKFMQLGEPGGNADRPSPSGVQSILTM